MEKNLVYYIHDYSYKYILYGFIVRLEIIFLNLLSSRRVRHMTSIICPTKKNECISVGCVHPFDLKGNRKKK